MNLPRRYKSIICPMLRETIPPLSKLRSPWDICVGTPVQRLHVFLAGALTTASASLSSKTCGHFGPWKCDENTSRTPSSAFVASRRSSPRPAGPARNRGSVTAFHGALFVLQLLVRLISLHPPHPPTQAASIGPAGCQTLYIYKTKSRITAGGHATACGNSPVFKSSMPRNRTA